MGMIMKPMRVRTNAIIWGKTLGRLRYHLESMNSVSVRADESSMYCLSHDQILINTWVKIFRRGGSWLGVEEWAMRLAMIDCACCVVYPVGAGCRMVPKKYIVVPWIWYAWGTSQGTLPGKERAFILAKKVGKEPLALGARYMGIVGSNAESEDWYASQYVGCLQSRSF